MSKKEDFTQTIFDCAEGGGFEIDLTEAGKQTFELAKQMAIDFHSWATDESSSAKVEFLFQEWLKTHK